jgi:hypothetical protein
MLDAIFRNLGLRNYDACKELDWLSIPFSLEEFIPNAGVTHC